MIPFIYTLCSSALGGRAPVVSPIDNFAESSWFGTAQIMPPGTINEEMFLIPPIKKIYPRWFLEKLLVPIETEYFQHCPRSSE